MILQRITNPCLITGCELFDPASGRWAHGDLFHYGDVFVFHAVCNEQGETNWQAGSLHDHNKIVIIKPLYNFFERRGVIVCEQLHCTLNESARNYVKEQL